VKLLPTVFLALFSHLFSLKYLGAYVLIILSTYALVVSGIDFKYLQFVTSNVPNSLLFIADITGFIIPPLLPLLLYLFGKLTTRPFFLLLSRATFYAVLLGFFVSTILKSFTGRQSPPHSHHGEIQTMIDNSHAFQFGFMREQIIGGWPSSHATISFALAVTLILLCPRSWFIKIGSVAFALFIAIGVTFGFHWLSECIAGILLGTVVGHIVGTHFAKQL